ncbi:hypothetical protein SLITO_v1c10370 [Spiroplasma litorale]|uniref:Uncharacterized protein n=1 Tax=Spiroplasma litorale TaxID=216942 RepID=A0A0K1W389_9MOLU|nr:hypothetical protein [Spiroplasma litorale]AKX34648.1 hypothetical protein SLITO_v1c10370 [Spiroplasma litorale]
MFRNLNVSKEDKKVIKNYIYDSLLSSNVFVFRKDSKTKSSNNSDFELSKKWTKIRNY